MGFIRSQSVLGIIAVLLLMPSGARAQSTGSFPDPSPPETTTTEPPSPPAPPQPPLAPAQPEYPTAPAVVQPEPYGPPPAGYPAPALAPALPPTLPYEDGQPIPPNYRLESRANSGLMLGGALTLGAGYAAGLIFAASSDFENGTSWTALPVVGPYGAIGARKFRCNKLALQDTDCFDKAVDEVEAITFLAVDGLVQAIGLTLVIVGAIDQRSFLVREDVQFALRPHRLRQGLGLDFEARF